MGLNRMTGVSWHIEKVKRKVNENSRNCFNCEYLNEHFCKKHQMSITNNNADICKHFINKYEPKTPKKKKEKPKVNSSELATRPIKTKPIDKSLVYTASTQFKHTFVQVDMTERKFNEITRKVFSENKYKIELDLIRPKKFANINPNLIFTAFLYNVDSNQYIKCIASSKSFKIIDNEQSLKISFDIVGFDNDSQFNGSKYRTICEGNSIGYKKVLIKEKK